MGGGVAGWLTPGWMSHERKLSPHISTPGKLIVFIISLCERNAQEWREPKRLSNRGM